MRIFSSSLLMACVISSRIWSIFLNCSSRISSRVFSADSFVMSLLLSSSISWWSLSLTSCSSSRESLTFSCRMRMHSECRCLICNRELWSWPTRFTLATFLTAIICCANTSVFTDSSALSSSGPMLAMSRARALPPRQSRSSMVSTESRCPCASPMFILLTTVPRDVRTRLMPIACFLLSSSSVSEAACTFLRLSEPARSTSMSLPRLQLGSLPAPPSERLSTVSMKRQ
mmetsp:Transcript_81357/g.209434  ORF Transcript_81357/g.209434 Transcript_81357/m.209434 type:complete len:229 (-) Transcript_81357:209-895(-)